MEGLLLILGLLVLLSAPIVALVALSKANTALKLAGNI